MLTDYEIELKIEKILNNNIINVNFEGDSIDKQQIIRDILDFIKSDELK